MIGYARFAYALILPAMRTDLHWGYTAAGWLNTANAIGYFLGAVISLATIRRHGPRALFVAGLVLATLAVMRGAGIGWPEAMRWANRAGGIVVGKLGTSVVTAEELA